MIHPARTLHGDHNRQNHIDEEKELQELEAVDDEQRQQVPHRFENSCERRVPASTASMSALRTPRASSAASPAIVVPPGVATRSFQTAGCSPLSSTSCAAPSSVC